MNQSSDLAQQIINQEAQNKEAIALLLDHFLGKNDFIFVQKTQMGQTPAYLGSVSLEWLASRVRFATQLPLFQQKFDIETHNIIRDAQTIEELQQRPLDWSRQAHLAQYLVARKNHKFPAVLVVMSSPWVDDPQSEEWDQNGQAQSSVTNFLPLDIQGNLGILDLSENFSIFALDGQHRLMGIQGLMELIRTGRLEKYNKNKTATGSVITTEDLMEIYQINSVDLQNLAKEKIGIELIPAVVKGETRDQARKRIRSIFVHVNLMAVNLSKGQLALLNEDDGFSIVARKIAVSHPLFRDEKERNPRVNWDSATVATKSTVLTTLQALQEMAEKYLGSVFPQWKPSEKGLIPLRPEDEEIEEGITLFNELFDYMLKLPSYQRLDDSQTNELRRFSHEKGGGGEGNLLFRPVGQVAIIQAIAWLHFREGLSLKNIFQKLQKYDREGGFSGMEYPQSLWYGILYNPNKKRIQVSGKDWASKLLVYLVKGSDDDLEKASLRRAIALGRSINEDQSIGFNGEIINSKEINLPLTL
jgi:DGQHR domain-containing protein